MTLAHAKLWNAEGLNKLDINGIFLKETRVYSRSGATKSLKILIAIYPLL